MSWQSFVMLQIIAYLSSGDHDARQVMATLRMG
jgi:hypothetical protein